MRKLKCQRKPKKKPQSPKRKRPESPRKESPRKESAGKESAGEEGRGEEGPREGSRQEGPSQEEGRAETPADYSQAAADRAALRTQRYVERRNGRISGAGQAQMGC